MGPTFIILKETYAVNGLNHTQSFQKEKKQ